LTTLLGKSIPSKKISIELATLDLELINIGSCGGEDVSGRVSKVG
jgi:hypothetical protein